KRVIIAAIVLLLVVLGFFVFAPKFQAIIRSRTETMLRTHFESDVQMSDFRISLFPLVRITIEGLVMRHKGRTDIPPLIEAREIYVDATLFGLLQPRPHISLVRLEGLRIHVPARQPGSKPLISSSDQDL